jgi:Glycosyl transferase family 2
MPQSDLDATLEVPLPDSVWAGEPTPFFVCGTVRSQREIAEVEVAVAGTTCPCDFHERLRPGRPLRFWAGLRGVPALPGTLPIELVARFRDGGAARAELGQIEVEKPPSPVAAPEGTSAGLIAICLASFDPDPGLLRGQIESLRSQSDPNWICVISDDYSRPDRRSEIEGLAGDDPRFILSVSGSRRGFYLNFERALRLAPPEADFIALCDQDDVWYSDKLATLRRAIGDAPLAYSDARLTDPTGVVIADSLWPDRRPNTADLPSVLVANSLAGASALMRADVARRALPFPRVPGWPFHDRWLPAVALSAGPIVRVDRPLYDYVQHEGAVLAGRFGAGRFGAGVNPPDRQAGWTPSLDVRWRGRFFHAYLPLRMYAQGLLDRDAVTGVAERRALNRFTAETPAAALRLSLRSLRPLFGRNETSALEWVAATGLLWRSWAGVCSRLGRSSGRCDTAPPPLNLWDLAPPRWG